MFPDNHKDRITCHDITRDVLIYGTEVRILNVTCIYVSTEYSHWKDGVKVAAGVRSLRSQVCG